MKKIITTVGTSLFTNYMKPEAQAMIEGYQCIVKPFDVLDTCIDASDRKPDKEKEIRDEMQYWLTLDNPNACAEIKSLSKIAEQEGDIEVYLLATDTVLSVLACELIRDFLKKEMTFANGKVKNIHFDNGLIVKGLNVKSASSFQKIGFQELLKIIRKKSLEVKQYNFNKNDNQKHGIILNISGGYKAIIPVITLIGQLEELPLSYIYEDSNELIPIGNLPIDFDWDLASQFYFFLSNENTLTDQSQKNPNKLIFNTMFDMKLIEKDVSGSIKKTILGDLIVEFVKEGLPIANEVMGYNAELKLLAFYSFNAYIAKDSSKFLFPSMKIPKGIAPMPHDRNKDKDFDLIIFEKENDRFKDKIEDIEGGFITFECKTANQYPNVLNQLKEQLKLLGDKKPKEHCLCLHFTKDIRFAINNEYAKGIIAKFQNDLDIVKKEYAVKGIILRVKYFFVVKNVIKPIRNSQYDWTSEYIAFMKEPIIVEPFC